MALRRLFRRQRPLGPTPDSEPRDEPARDNPGAEVVLAEADASLGQRERDGMPGCGARERLRKEADLYLEELVEEFGEPTPQQVADAKALVEDIRQAKQADC